MVPERKLDGNFTKDRKIHGKSNVWSTAQRQKRSIGLMFMLGLNEAIDQLLMANNVRWYGQVLRRKDGQVLRRKDGHVLRRALDFEVEGRWKKSRPKRTWKKQVDEESVEVGLRREDALCRSKWSVAQIRFLLGRGESGNPHLLRNLPDFKHWCASL